jgi:hypothetical protein
MTPESEFILEEVSSVAKIVRDECWLEGERRGVSVDPRDAVVQERVADIILSGVGAEIRSVIEKTRQSA